MAWATIVLNALIALFTGVSAWVSWRKWRGGVQVEWWHSWHAMYEKSIPPTLEIKTTIRNYTKSGIRVVSAEALTDAVKQISAGRESVNTTSIEADKTYLSIELEPGGSKSLTIKVVLDWKALQDRQSSRWVRRSFTKLPIQVLTVSRPRKRSVTRHRTKIAIPKKMIEDAAKVAASQTI